MSVKLAAAVAASVFLFAGCGSSSDPLGFGPQNPGSTIIATESVYVQGPPVNGQVTVSDANGTILDQEPALAGLATLKLPASAVAAGAPPLHVTFEVEDQAHLETGSGPATFSAKVPHPVAGDIVGVDGVSTLIALYHRAHPELSFEAAAAHVFEHLHLPADTDPEHLFQDTPFDSSLLSRAAADAGGLDRLLDQIVAEIPSEMTSQGRFLKADIALSGAVDTIATGLAESALDYVLGTVKGKVIGWLEGVFGIPQEPSVQDVLDAVAQVRQDIERLSRQIENQANIQAYNDKDRVLIKERADADAFTATLTGWASRNNLVPPPQQVIADKMQEIRTRFNSTLITAAELELPQTGAGGATNLGLAGLYLNAAVPRLYSATTKERATYHLQRSLGFQQLVLNLLVESLHFAGPSLLYDAERAIDTYLANARLQRQQYPFPFDEENVLLDRGTNLLWTRRPIILNDIRELDGFLASYTLSNAPAGSWRLPTRAEMAQLGAAVGNTNAGLQRDGFLPLGSATAVGDWGLRSNFDYKVVTAPLTRRFERINQVYQTEADLVDVRNFGATSGILLIDYGRTQRPFPAAFYLVRTAPRVNSITVSEVSRSTHEIAYRATARLSDGSDRDVTGIVKWSLTTASGNPITLDVARILNLPDRSGIVSVRASNNAPMKVVATYKDVEGTATTPTLTFAPPAITAILVHPLRYEVPSGGYLFDLVQIEFHATVARTNGALAAADSEVTWTTSDTSLATVSASGLVTAKRPARKTIIDIKATFGRITQTSKLVLNP